MTTLNIRTGRAITRTAAVAFAAAVVTSTLGMPSASAGPNELFAMIKSAHASAGCNAYGVAPALGDVAVQLSKTMAANGGRQGSPGTFAPNAENLLNGRGYFTNGLAEMDYFNPSGAGSSEDAFNFWSSRGNPFSDCGLQQLGVGISIVDGKNYAAVALFATPGSAPGPLPAADQPR